MKFLQNRWVKYPSFSIFFTILRKGIVLAQTPLCGEWCLTPTQLSLKAQNSFEKLWSRHLCKTVLASAKIVKNKRKNHSIYEICLILAGVFTKQLEWVCIWVDNCFKTNSLLLIDGQNIIYSQFLATKARFTRFLG